MGGAVGTRRARSFGNRRVGLRSRHLSQNVGAMYRVSWHGMVFQRSLHLEDLMGVRWVMERRRDRNQSHGGLILAVGMVRCRCMRVGGCGKIESPRLICLPYRDRQRLDSVMKCRAMCGCSGLFVKLRVPEFGWGGMFMLVARRPLARYSWLKHRQAIQMIQCFHESPTAEFSSISWSVQTRKLSWISRSRNMYPISGGNQSFGEDRVTLCH